jgi:hypothetical protein
MKAKGIAVACLLLACTLVLPGCANYRRLAEAIGNRVRPATEASTARPTTRRTTERATPTPRPTTTTTTQTSAATTTQTTQTAGQPPRRPHADETDPPFVSYSVNEAFRFEEGAVTVALPIIEPDDERSGSLNDEELKLRIAYEQSLCEDGFEAAVYYAVDYFYQFDGTCLTLVIESIAGWVDSEAYYMYSVYHYDLASAVFLDNRAYLDVMQIQPETLEQQVEAYTNANLDTDAYQVRPLDEAMFVIFDGVCYYEVLSLEYDDFWLEDMGPVGEDSCVPDRGETMRARTERIVSKNAAWQKFEVLKTNRNKRYRYRQFFVEGVRNINEAVRCSWTIDAWIYSFEKHLSDWARDLLNRVRCPCNTLCRRP